MLWMFLFFVHEAEGQTTTTYTQQLSEYDLSAIANGQGGSGASYNNGGAEVGMWMNGDNSANGFAGNVSWKTFRIGSSTLSAARPLQVGDEVIITVATRGVFWGQLGVSFNSGALPTGSWANRFSGRRLSVNQDGGNFGSGGGRGAFYYTNGSTAASFGVTPNGNFVDYTIVFRLTSLDRCNISVNGVTYSDVPLGGTSGASITNFSIYISDDRYDNTNRSDSYWKQATTVTNTGALNIGGSNTNYTISGVIPNGLVSNTTGTSFTNNLTKNGTGSITLGASNTYTGSTTVNGGTLILNTTATLPVSNTVAINGGNLQLNHPSALSGSNAVALTNGTLSVGTTPTGTVAIGALAISPGTSINLGTGTNTFDLTIASTSGLASGNLTINNWSPSSGKRILITDITHINNTAVLDRINFNGFGVGAKLINTNELVPKFLYYTNAASSGMFSNLSSWLNGMPTLFDGTETIYVQPGFTLTQNMMTLSLLKVVVGGTLIITGPNSIITPNSVNAGVENTGSIIMNTGSVINIGNGATFLNSGSISMSLVATINMNAGSTWAGNGTIGTDGIINFTNGGAITSTSTLPNVIIVGNVNFNTSTIGNSLEIRGGGAVTPNAPFYAPGSTLIYNVSGTYNRNTEWGSNAGQGYPSNVRVSTGTTLNLNANPISATAFGIGGNLTVQSGATLNTGALNTTSFTVNGNTDINGTFDATGMTGGVNDLFFIGNLSIAGTLSLSNVNGNDLYLSGNWSRTGTFNANNRAVYLRGGNSTISATGGQSFPFLRIEKTAATNTITLNNPVTITNEVSFTTGVVVSTSAIPFIIADNATSVGGSGNSFVDGTLRKVGNDAFTFPVGDRVGSVNHYRTIGISAPTNATDAFDAEFVVANARLLGTVVSPLVRVSKCEYWNLNRFAGSSDVFVTLSWSAQSNCNVTYVDDLSTLVVAHNGGGLWTTRGQSAATGGGAAGTVTSFAAVSTFSPFALGSTDQNSNPLPFNLLSFNGRSRTNDIELSFSVKGNDEQQQYLLERSADGRSFVQLNTIAARQNLTEADYTTLDEQPINGWNFYRLTAVDLTGAKKQSQIIRVWFGSRGGKPAVYPNPVQGDAIQLFTGGLLKGTYTVQLRAQDGKLLLSRTWVYDGVAPVYSIATEGKLAAGMYWLSITAPHQPPISIKVIK